MASEVRSEESLAEIRRAKEIDPLSPVINAGDVWVLYYARRLPEIYAKLGDKDNAFGWLERSAADRTYNMIYLKVAPNLDPLRSDPRFPELLGRIGLS
ncbi:MAG: hypothetical protein ABL984_15275 [Pyrinomonadaceae bacterium]